MRVLRIKFIGRWHIQLLAQQGINLKKISCTQILNENRLDRTYYKKTALSKTAITMILVILFKIVKASLSSSNQGTDGQCIVFNNLSKFSQKSHFNSSNLLLIIALQPIFCFVLLLLTKIFHSILPKYIHYQVKCNQDATEKCKV